MQNSSAVPPRVDLVVQPSTPPPPRATWDVLAQAAWPLAAVLIVVMLRRAIGDALKGLTARATRLSVGVVAIELAESTARSWGSGAALDEIRDAASTAPVGDSGSALIASLSDPTPADYAVVDLGSGGEWLTSRLFAVATIVARLRGLRAVVFTMSDPAGPKVLGTTTVDALRRALAARYPWLDLAYAAAWTPAFNGMLPSDIELVHLNRSFPDPVDPWRAGQMLEAFKAVLQRTVAPASSGWVEIRAGFWERAEWVTPALIADLLGSRLVRSGVVRDLDSTAEQFARRVLRAEGDFVPVVDANDLFHSVVNRRSFIDRTVKTLADNR